MSMPANTTPQAQTNWTDVVRGGIPPRSKTILLVEDESFVREVACEVLSAAGYEIIPAVNAAEATRYYERPDRSVDLLLTDVVLPDENGYILAKVLRERSPALKVLFVTGYAEQMNRCLSPDELLAKPFSKGLLLQKVSRMLDKGCSI